MSKFRQTNSIAPLCVILACVFLTTFFFQNHIACFGNDGTVQIEYVCEVDPQAEHLSCCPTEEIARLAANKGCGDCADLPLLTEIANVVSSNNTRRFCEDDSQILADSPAPVEAPQSPEGQSPNRILTLASIGPPGPDILSSCILIC